MRRWLPILLLTFLLVASTPPSFAQASENLDWTLQTTPEANYGDVTWSPAEALFVAVASSACSSSCAFTSPDGASWTSRSTGIDGWQGVTWSEDLSKFVAVRGGTTSGDQIMTSPNGVTWTTHSAPVESYQDVIWVTELNLFIAVSGDNIIRSSDGESWTQTTTPFGGGVAWSPSLELLVSVGLDDAFTSSDGVQWTGQTMVTGQWDSVDWSPKLGLFVAVGNDGIASSPDGTTWTLETGTSNLEDIKWSPEYELFVTVGINKAFTSLDGENWTAQSEPSGNWQGVTWSPDLLIFSSVANTFSGTVGSRAMTGEDPEFVAPVELPEGWDSPAEGTDPVFTFPEGANPRGVSITTDPRTDRWSIMSGYFASTNQGVIDLLRTTDQGANFNTRNFRTNSGELEVGGMAQGPDIFKGCFQEANSEGSGSKVMVYTTKDGSSFRILNPTTFNLPVVDFGPSAGTNLSPLLCDVGTPKDEAGRDDWTSVVFGSDGANSKWMVIDKTGNPITPVVDIPGSKQVGTDMMIRIKDADVTSYISTTTSSGPRLTPIIGSSIHWHVLADLNSLINIRSFHHTIDTEGFKDFGTAFSESGLNHADTAVSSVNNVMVVWADETKNSIRFLESDPRGTNVRVREPPDLMTGTITTANNVNWIRIVPTGQGTYAGLYTQTNGNLTFIQTNNNGASWTNETIANDVETSDTRNHRKADLSYDRVNESIVLVWSTEDGVRLAFQSLSSGTPLVDVERDWDIAPVENEFREPDTFIGVNLQDQGDSTGMGLFGVKMLIIAAFAGLTILFTYLFTFNAIMALGAGGSLSLLLLVVWGIMPLWVLIALIFFFAYIITNHFAKRNSGGETAE